VRRLVVLLVVVLLLVVAAAELVGPRVAERSIARGVQESGGLGGRPEVEVRGRPFLTQLVRGRYDDVVIRATGVPAGRLRFQSLVTRLQGARVPLRRVVTGSTAPVPVDRLSSRAVVTYEALTGVVRDRGLRVSPGGDGLVRVTGSVEVLGRTLEATAVSRPTLEGGELVVTAERFEVGNAVVDAVISRALGNRLDFRVELPPLPFGLELTALQAGADGVVVTAEAMDAVLRQP
jgi:hypothetical protein